MLQTYRIDLVNTIILKCIRLLNRSVCNGIGVNVNIIIKFGDGKALESTRGWDENILPAFGYSVLKFPMFTFLVILLFLNPFNFYRSPQTYFPHHQAQPFRQSTHSCSNKRDMSLLESSRLMSAQKIYLQWDPKSPVSHPVPAVVTAVRMGPDMNPCRLYIEVTRLEKRDCEDATTTLVLQEGKNADKPSLVILDSQDAVTWSTHPETTLRQLKEMTKFKSWNQLDRMEDGFRRPIRVLSYEVQYKISRFPVVSTKDMSKHANIVQRDITASTSCTLLEWESLSKHISTSLNLPVVHFPIYGMQDVPRHDTVEMRILFSTIHDILKVFIHFTSGNVYKMMVKSKTRRGRRTKAANQFCAGGNVDLFQIIGNFVTRQNGFAFTVGAMFNPKISMRPGFRYPVLARASNEWNNLDRRFTDEITLEWISESELQAVCQTDTAYDAAREGGQSRIGRKKKMTEPFLGFKWIHRP